MTRSLKLVTICAAAVLAAPFMLSAQSAGLSNAIRAEIMKDPRSSDIPPAQIEAMVVALAQTASAQGVSESDITWKPVRAESATGSVECGFFCTINRIFGFGGDDYTIPIGLGVTSALLILFISMMLHRHHVHGVEPTVEAIHMPAQKKRAKA
ncbi:MAG: hypothetical protein KBD06_04615 [Candidatus Pacebacteria bacterium]|nr:hypothetical protein [Candidatus Paceibacterota bacterium]